jgi:hypothetical protein
MYPHIHFRSYIIEIPKVKIGEKKAKGKMDLFVLVSYQYGATY